MVVYNQISWARIFNILVFRKGNKNKIIAFGEKKIKDRKKRDKEER